MVLSIGAAVSFYWIVSIGLVFINKYVMSGGLQLDSPILLTWTQITTALLLSLALRLVGTLANLSFLRGIQTFSFNFQIAKKLLPVTAAFIGMILCNNLCLRYVQVSFYQVARSMTIVFSVILSYVLFKQTTSTKSLAACLVVVVGYALGCEGEIEFSLLGGLYGLAASMFVAVYSLLVKQYMPLVGGDSWTLLIYNNLNAFVILPLLVLADPNERNAMTTFAEYNDSKFWGMLLISGIFGFLINIASFVQISSTSALSHNVSGTAKAAAQTALAFLVSGNTFTVRGLVGLSLVLVGSFAYAWLRNEEMKEENVDEDEKVRQELKSRMSAALSKAKRPRKSLPKSKDSSPTKTPEKNTQTPRRRYNLRNRNSTPSS